MRTPSYTRQFERDVQRMKRRGKPMEKLKSMIRTLVEERTPDPLHRDHALIGNWKGRRECHLEYDWLLIYKIDADRIIFERTGTHTDLFK
ncbi:type II toxin-antitoxin system YafQ family toxin [bacterium]|nr:type II toxin-antitoxin system YafQ family toxin [bacterium]